MDSLATAFPEGRASATTGRYTRFRYRRSETCFDRAVRYRGISIATAVEEEAARAFIAGCYDYFRSPLPYGNPSVIAGSSMKLESLNKRAAPNLSGRQVSGRCLCGAVKLEIDFPAFWAWHDHSTASRRAHGAAYATYIGCWRSTPAWRRADEASLASRMRRRSRPEASAPGAARRCSTSASARRTWSISRGHSSPAVPAASPAITWPVKGWTVMVNGICNGWRMEDVWLDKQPVAARPRRDGGGDTDTGAISCLR